MKSRPGPPKPVTFTLYLADVGHAQQCESHKGHLFDKIGRNKQNSRLVSTSNLPSLSVNSDLQVLHLSVVHKLNLNAGT